MELYQKYSRDMQQTLKLMPWKKVDDIVKLLHTVRMQGNTIFVVGNGGSASTAQHMACDLGKNTAVTGVPRIRALSLNDNMATFSAHANDNSYENVFAEQLVNFVSEGDALVAISTSGNSRNVLNAVDVANALGAITIGWSGNNGGKLAKLVDMSIVVPNFCIEQIEDMHMIMEHIVTMALREAAVAERKARLGQQESVLVPLPAQPMVQNPAHPFSAA